MGRKPKNKSAYRIVPTYGRKDKRNKQNPRRQRSNYKVIVAPSKKKKPISFQRLWSLLIHKLDKTCDTGFAKYWFNLKSKREAYGRLVKIISNGIIGVIVGYEYCDDMMVTIIRVEISDGHNIELHPSRLEFPTKKEKEDYYSRFN